MEQKKRHPRQSYVNDSLVFRTRNYCNESDVMPAWLRITAPNYPSNIRPGGHGPQSALTVGDFDGIDTANMTAKEIAKKVHATPAAVSRFLHTHNMPFIQERGGLRESAIPLEELKKLDTANMTSKELATRFGVKPHTVTSFCAYHQIPYKNFR